MKTKLMRFVSVLLIFVLATGNVAYTAETFSVDESFVQAYENSVCTDFVVPFSQDVNFARLLQYSLFFFDSNMCGPEVSSRSAFAWRHSCHIQDTEATPVPPISGMPTVDVSGGFHDAGDHIKFGLPQSYSALVLGWAVYEYPEAFEENGLTPHAQRILDHFAEYMRRSTHWSDDGNSVIRFFYQVGDGSAAHDHGFWGPPQYQTRDKIGGNRRAYWTDATAGNPGADQIAFGAAALAMNYLNFGNPEDLRHARALYDLVWNGNRDVSTRANGFYTSTSVDDKIIIAAELLHIATGVQTYKTQANTLMAAQNFRHHTTWPLAWDSAWPMINTIREDWQAVETNMGPVRSNMSRPFYEHTSWGSTRYNTAFQMVGLIADARRGRSDYGDWAARQMDFITGNNPHRRSFVVGFDRGIAGNHDCMTTLLHHRAATGFGDANTENGGGWPPFEANENPIHKNTGALVGGPNGGEYRNIYNLYTYTEVAIDFNASLAGAAAGLWMLNKSHQPDAPTDIPGDFRMELLLGSGDFAKVNAARGLLTWDSISSEPQNAVTLNLNLPTVIGDGVAVSWVSENIAISETGAVSRQTTDTTGTLTATLSYGVASATVTFNPTVLLLEDPAVIRQILLNRIQYANELMDSTEVSENGEDVPFELDWVTQAVLDALTAQRDNALTVLDNVNATALELNTALTSLNEEITIFENARTHGLIGYVPHFDVVIQDSYAAESGEGSYPEGALVVVSAGTRDDSHFFNGWSGADANLLSDINSSIAYLTMPERDVNITATWLRIGGGDIFPMTLRAAMNEPRLSHARFANGHATDGSPEPNRPTEPISGNSAAVSHTVTAPGDFTLILTEASLWNIPAGTASAHWPEVVPDLSTGGRVVHITVDADGYVTILPTSGGTFDGHYFETGNGRVSTLPGTDEVFISYGESHPTGHTPGSPPSGAVETYTVTVQESFAQVTGAGNFPEGRTIAINAGNPPLRTFSGWTTDSNVIFADATSPITTFIMPESDVTVKANWITQIPVYYTVNFDLAGGELVSGELEQEILHGDNATPPTVTRDDYDFVGWDGSYTNITAPVTITALWQPSTTESFTVIFDLAGGELVSGELEQTILRGHNATPPTVTRDDYDFVGWDGVYTNITAPVTITALWQPSSTTGSFKVIFDLAGGELVSGELEQTIMRGHNATPPTVTRDNYDFVGWDGVYTNITAPVTITALWKPILNDVLIGDINGDGRITSADSTELARFLLADAQPLTPEQLRQKDINCDGGVDVNDLIHLSQWLIGIVTQRCVNTNCEYC